VIDAVPLGGAAAAGAAAAAAAAGGSGGWLSGGVAAGTAGSTSTSATGASILARKGEVVSGLGEGLRVTVVDLEGVRGGGREGEGVRMGEGESGEGVMRGPKQSSCEAFKA
jgi:hypothetical protein